MPSECRTKKIATIAMSADHDAIQLAVLADEALGDRFVLVRTRKAEPEHHVEQDADARDEREQRERDAHRALFDARVEWRFRRRRLR